MKAGDKGLPTEEELALKVQRGDRQALAALVKHHHSPLIGFFYRMTDGDRTLAEDLAQETFMRLMRAIHSYAYPRPFKPWLYAIATNLARDHYKRAATRYQIDTEPDQLHQYPAEPPEEMLTAADDARQVAEVLTTLPDHQREVVILRYYQELSLAEIATALNIPVGTVKSRLSLGLRRLKTVLEREAEHYDEQ